MKKQIEKPAKAERKQGRDTRFKPGKSGNPAGKPPGTRNKTTMAAQALLDNESQALTRKAVELALKGDMAALRLCLDRVLPPSRERPVSIDLPDTSTAEGISLAADAILCATAKGELLPGEATVLSNIVDKRRAAMELNEIESRLKKLEESQNERNN